VAPSGYTEDQLIEQPTVELFKSLGWETGNLYHEFDGGKSTEGREGRRDVHLPNRLRAALERLNPDIPFEGITQAIEQLTTDRGKMIPVNANQDVYRLLKHGAKVSVFDQRGEQITETVKIIDWNNPHKNEFFLASQFWVASEFYTRRCDLVGFVNGIPLLLMELKATHKHVKHAYDGNLSDYRSAIPHFFTPNGFIILSNGTETRIGATFAGWDHFLEWKKVADEAEQGVISLETVVRGTCTPEHLLDIIENFTVFEEGHGGLAKKVAKNHQYLGVNKAIEEVKNLKENKGRLGVFWHTQGSGKSLSMVFLTQKILRTLRGNWTFVIVTDRKELDNQIYKTFAATGAVTDAEAHAETSAELVQLLKEDHRYVFTLIQKFRTESGQTHPVLSNRHDIIVITDEAHRSQYDVFALNMRNALPNASFIGFTGTPLMAGEEKTREVFGDYVSVYNFAQSIEDGATVPLYYENRIPELQLTNENLNEDMEQLLEAAELDEAQEKKLEREFAREYHLITREERLETIAEDLVQHFLGRGYRGKAMMICIDKATAVRMYDKVRAHWNIHLRELYKELPKASFARQEMIHATIAEMGRTDMAVVVSQSQGEVEEMKRKGLDILAHRKRMVTENLDEKFKDPNDHLRLVFVCAMWITGFDVPECSTIYLDKPMRNHTLMQTIARANRVTEGKEAGLIVDYVGIFRNLQKALAIYAKPSEGETPILDKQKLVQYLKVAIEEAVQFSAQKGGNLEAIKKADGYQRVKLLDDAVEAVVSSEGAKKIFLNMAAKIARVFRAIKPDPMCNQFLADVALICEIGKKIKGIAAPADISEVMKDIEALLDDSIATEGYRIVREEVPDAHPLIDLSKIDFEALKKRFANQRKHTETERLKALITRTLNKMVQQNRSRMDFLDRFQRMIDEYNSGAKNIEQLFEELLRFAQSLKEEEQRAVREELTEEELAIFDILTKPEPQLTKKEQAQVKKVVRELLDKLKREKLVLDWQKQQRTKATVKVFIEEFFDSNLPEKYDKEMFQAKCDITFMHVYDVYGGYRSGVECQTALP
jgi:type I restriction enzyme, R subunit